MTEGKWAALPADSEAQVDYEGPMPTVSVGGVSYPLLPEVRVTMDVYFPDGHRLSYEEAVEIPDDSIIDESAQALASAEAVTKVILTRLTEIQE